MLEVRVFVLALLALGVGVSGCGGGDATPGVNVLVVWPDRAREVNAPKSANYASLVVWTSSTTFVTSGKVSRGTDSGTHFLRIATPTSVPEGIYRIVVSFFANAGDVQPVAVADFSGKVDKKGDVFNPDGSHLGPINYKSRIEALAVGLQSSLFSSTPPVYTLYGTDSSSNLLAIDPVALKISSQTGPGQLVINKDNSMSVVNAGQDTIVFEVDGVKTAARDFRLFASMKVKVAPVSMMVSPSTGNLWAVTASPDNRLVEIDPSTGEVSTSIALGQACSFARISSDGSTAYVVVKGSTNVLKVDVLSGVITPTAFNPPVAMTNPAIFDLAIKPSTPTTVAVTFMSGSAVVGRATIFDSGLVRPISLASTQNIYPMWIDDATLYLGSTSGGLGTNYAVTSAGIGAAVGVSTVAEGRAKLVNGALYTMAGNILNPNSLAKIGKFSQPSIGIAMDFRPETDTTLYTDPTVAPAIGYLTFTLASASPAVKTRFTVNGLVGSLTGLSSAPGPVLVGPDTVAISDGQAIYLVRGMAG